MKSMVIGAALAAVVSTGALAQQPGEPVTRGAGSFVLVPYAGYIIYGDLAEFSSGTEFSNDDGALFGVQAGWRKMHTYLKVEKDKGDFTFQGIWFGGAVRF